MRCRQGSPTLLAASALVSGLRVKINSAGALAAADALDLEIGTVESRALATNDPASYAPLPVDGTVWMVSSGAISQYAEVFASDGGKITSTPNGNYLGFALNAASVDGDRVEVVRTQRRHRRLFNSIAASAAVTNTVAETAFDQSLTLPANFLKAGDRIRVRLLVLATATNSTDTLNVKLKIGSTIIAATGALDVANNDVAYIDAELTIRTSGASGTCVAAAISSIGPPASATLKAQQLASTAIDTTATQAITVTATWSVANAGNSCRLDTLSIDLLP